jgi:hypothetical protein
MGPIRPIEVQLGWLDPEPAGWSLDGEDAPDR